MDETMSWIPSCSDVARAVSDDSYNEASPSRRVMLRLHMAVCWFCRRYAAQIRWIDRAARETWGVPAPGDADVKRRLISRLKS